MITRRVMLVSAAVSAACSRAPEIEPPRLPAKLGRWTLEYKPQPLDGLIPVATAGWRYSYLGVPDVTLKLYALPSQTSAFDATQKWRPAPGKLAFYKGRFFGIAEADGGQFATLNDFVTNVQPLLPER